jgi:origin recognition complex subunit 5
MNVYHSSLHSLYEQFVSLLCDVCYPFTSDPIEIQYIAAARWPGFVEPVAAGDLELTEETRMQLIRNVKPTLTRALEELYPRHTNALNWALQSASEDVEMEPEESRASRALAGLPTIPKFVIVAAFIASSNPAKSDLRMFGRGLDEKKRKRRIPRKQPATASTAKVIKIPQKYLGPSPFPLDRLLAILSALIEENDPPPEGETDMEVSRATVYGAVTELAQMRLLVRTNAADRLDGPPMYKCGVGYELVLGLAREIKVPLNDLLWDSV